MRQYSEATDAAGITHHVRGELRYVARRGRKRRRGKGGHYETSKGCLWWCTNAEIREGSRAHPGKPVDCIACVANPPPAPPVRDYHVNYAGTATGRMSYFGTPSGPSAVFDTGVARTMRTRRR